MVPLSLHLWGTDRECGCTISEDALYLFAILTSDGVPSDTLCVVSATNVY